MTENEAEGLALLKHYAADPDGRVVLNRMAESILVAHGFGEKNWTPTVRKLNGWTVNLRISTTYAITLRQNKIEILLVPGLLSDEERDVLEKAARNKSEFKQTPGSWRYSLDWPKAAELWRTIEKAHHEVLRFKGRPSGTKNPEASAVTDFLNAELNLGLPSPTDDLVDPTLGKGSTPRSGQDVTGSNGDQSPAPERAGNFGALLQSLSAAGLQFSREVVANYVLALQTKRFAILTGISGTGKTQIAMAVARAFPATIRDQRTPTPAAAAMSDDAIRMTAWPSHFKYRQIVLPVAFVARIEPFLVRDPGSNGGEIAVSYPEGLTKVRFWRDPNPSRNVTGILFGGAHDFRDWYAANLEPGDTFFIGFREGEGPGKHRIDFRLAETEVVDQQIENCAVVPVRPDWVDNRGLLGYFNPLTNGYSTTPFLLRLLEAQAEVERAEKEKRDPHPFFVVLDEMNLARVEHYFSDFLSALESGEAIPLHDSQEIEEGQNEAEVPKNLKVPNNVFFTGTVNVDETTHMFSPKVLDRAFTIEFDRVDLEGYTTGEHSEEPFGLNLDSADDFSLKPYRRPGREDWKEFNARHRKLYKTLLKLQGILEPEHRHFGYRVANEIARFVNLAREQSTDKDGAARAAFDLAMLQKVLPKFHGTQQELEPVLRKLFRFAVLGSAGTQGGDENLKLSAWKVADGRLLPASAGTLVVGTEPDGEEVSAESGGTETADTADTVEVPASQDEHRTPAFPRTGAKIWRMLRRLQQRGFTSFIE